MASPKEIKSLEVSAYAITLFHLSNTWCEQSTTLSYKSQSQSSFRLSKDPIFFQRCDLIGEKFEYVPFTLLLQLHSKIICIMLSVRYKKIRDRVQIILFVTLSLSKCFYCQISTSSI